MVPIFPLAFEGVDFTAAYTVSTSVPEYPGAVHAGQDARQRRQRWTVDFRRRGRLITANDLAVISTASTFTATALSNTTAKGFLGKIGGQGRATVTSGQYFWLQVAGYAASVNCRPRPRGEYRAGQHHHGGASRRRVGGQLGQGDRLVLVATAASNTAAAILNFPAIGTDD